METRTDHIKSKSSRRYMRAALIAAILVLAGCLAAAGWALVGAWGGPEQPDAVVSATHDGGDPDLTAASSGDAPARALQAGVPASDPSSSDPPPGLPLAEGSAEPPSRPAVDLSVLSSLVDDARPTTTPTPDRIEAAEPTVEPEDIVEPVESDPDVDTDAETTADEAEPPANDDDFEFQPVVVPGSVASPGNSGWTNNHPPAVGSPPATETSSRDAAPVPLDVIGAVTPVPVPERNSTTAIPVLADSGRADDLTGNAFGCQSTCIVSAQVEIESLQPSLTVSIETNVAAQHLLWVLPAGPLVVNGVPAHAGKVPYATSPGSGHDWEHTISSLNYDTSYRLVLAAIDNQGNSEYASTIVTTTGAPADDLAGNPGSTCYYTCIESATVDIGPTYDLAKLTIVPSEQGLTIEAYVSTSEPGTIAGNPFLTNQVVQEHTNGDYGTRRIYLKYLEPDTTYHVVVKVTDDEGFRDYAVGQFRSLPLPPPPPPPQEVAIWFDRFHVHQNGDLVGRGEIVFSYAVDTYGFSQGPDKLSDGESIDAGGGRVVEVGENGELPRIKAEGWDMDTFFGDQYSSATTGFEFVMDFEDVLNLATCESLGYASPYPSDRCMVASAPPYGGIDPPVIFDALIKFRVL